MDTQELLMTAARGLAVYLFMLVVIRLLGKREVGNFSAFDLLVALMLGEVVDEVIYGDVNMMQGAVAVLVIALLQYVTGWIAYMDHGMEAIIEGSPTVVVRDGQIQQDGLRKERMSPHDVMGQLRMHGIDDLREVQLAVVETNGQVSAVKKDWAESVQKGDLDGPEAEQKRRDTGGQEDPPEDKDTTAEKHLK